MPDIPIIMPQLGESIAEATVVNIGVKIGDNIEADQEVIEVVTIEDFEKFLAHLEKNKMSPASTMRVAVADAMRRSWARPLATVALPVNIDPVLAHRKKSNPKPGPALYALRALALALAENSAP